jgi:hypothetical protein
MGPRISKLLVHLPIPHLMQYNIRLHQLEEAISDSFILTKAFNPHDTEQNKH